QCSFSYTHSAAARMTMKLGSTTISSVMYEKRSSRGVASRQPTSAAVALVIRPPTSTIAPKTCTKTARSMSLGRIAASISGTRLEEHVGEDEHEDDGRREGKGQPGRRLQPSADLVVGALAALRELLDVGVVGAAPLADPD